MKLLLALFLVPLALPTVLRAAAAQPSTNLVPTVITADKMEYDYEEQIAYLKGRVIVRDERGSLAADNATVYFERDKSSDSTSPASSDVGNFQRVVAYGNVKMQSGDRIAIADKAVWNRAEAKIVLTGGPPMVKQGTSYIKAERITFDIKSQRFEFHPNPEIVFQASEEQKQRFMQ
ncbi:MAG: hypothetical protein N2595_10105 [bacterium]|nr:hypothetical protein [bacterium]